MQHSKLNLELERLYFISYFQLVRYKKILISRNRYFVQCLLLVVINI